MTNANDRQPSARRIAALAYPGVQLLDIVGPLETFNLAAQQRIDDGEATQRAYVVDVIAKDATTGPSMSGLSMLATRTLDHPVDDIDTLIVPGALTGDRFFEDPDYVEFVRRASRKVRRTCSVCSGALLLAAAGLLDGRRATTHWMDAPTLKRDYPRVKVEDNRIFTQDGDIYTSGGITAGIDLALALVEQDHSRRLALRVAKRLLVFLRRPGNQLQFNSLLEAQVAPTRFAGLADWLNEHLESELTPAQAASFACMSERTFRRHFEAEYGMPFSNYLAKLRVTRARALLETTDLQVADVARRCGFSSSKAMRHRFTQDLDVTPSEYRARFGEGHALQ